MTKWFIFIAVSVGLAFLSLPSLRLPRSHGFWRFFAFASIVGLALLNIGEWFIDPWSPHQMISWMCLGISLWLVLDGVRLLWTVGKPDGRRQEASLLEFEKTTTLVTTGVFKYIRHPLYNSLLFLAWGIFFKLPGWEAGILALLATTFLVQTAKADEAECIRFFGSNYKAYMKRTRKFIPYLY
jgi:protein-S-isoprenylcysteine O-methyltransferase Ste14